MSWHHGPLMAFDLETTGTGVEQDRIVTAAIVEVNTGTGDVETRTWLVDPGIDIPEQATAVHGVTTAQARADGMSPDVAVTEIEQTLLGAWGSGTPVIVYNAPFDLSLLDRELRRYGGRGLEVGPVVDPLVLDKQLDRYRKGSRKLASVCEHYGIRLADADAHTADADALAAARLAWVLAQRYPDARADLDELQHWQARWFAARADDFETYLRRTKRYEGASGDEIHAIQINRHWPLIPHRSADAEETPA